MILMVKILKEETRYHQTEDVLLDVDLVGDVEGCDTSL